MNEIIYQYWQNCDTGKITKREIGDPPYGDLWFEIDPPHNFKVQVNVDKRGWVDCIKMPSFDTREQAEQWLKDNRVDELIALLPVIEFQIVPVQS
jgi:hypothetical protein